MDVDSLISLCSAMGITLTPLPSGKLRALGAEVIPDRIRTEIKTHKLKIIAILEHKQEFHKAVDRHRPRPYLTQNGELIIPMDAAPQYHWWAGGQSLRTTLLELKAPPEVVGRYIEPETTTQH